MLLVILLFIVIFAVITLWIQRLGEEPKNPEIELVLNKKKAIKNSFNNKTIKIPNNIKTYDLHPYAPDFGAFVGKDCIDSFNAANLTIYRYKMFPRPDKDSGDYVQLLLDCGYTYKGNEKVEDDYHSWYYHEASQTKIDVGLEDYDYVITVSN